MTDSRPSTRNGLKDTSPCGFKQIVPAPTKWHVRFAELGQQRLSYLKTRKSRQARAWGPKARGQAGPRDAGASGGRGDLESGRPGAGPGLGQHRPDPGRKPREPPQERGDRRRWTALTCPFSEPRSDPCLVTQTPDPKGREERVRDAQGHVGHGACADPVQEAGGRKSALHGFQLGLTTFVNGKTNE